MHFNADISWLQVGWPASFNFLLCLTQRERLLCPARSLGCSDKIKTSHDGELNSLSFIAYLVI